MRIGIDFGGVLAATTSPPDNFLDVLPYPKCRETIADWRAQGHVPTLISKAGDSAKQTKAELWLAYYQFNGLFGDNIEFCRDQEDKIEICTRLEVDVMIDDTRRQLDLLAGVVACRILFGSSEAPDGMVAAVDWDETRNVVASLRLQ